MNLIKRRKIGLRAEDYADPFWSVMIDLNIFSDGLWQHVSNNTDGRVDVYIHSIVKRSIKFMLTNQ